MQLTLEQTSVKFYPPKTQLLKWVGNKQRYAQEISKYFPLSFNRLIEPFFGSGAVTATVSPSMGLGSDTYKPLIEIWNQLKLDPEELIKWYSDRLNRLSFYSKEEVYEQVKTSFNSKPNGADLLFLSRTCYGGIIRFRKLDGFMSTPCGVHNPISVDSFKKRVIEWNIRLKNVRFLCHDFKESFEIAKAGDLIYCDPPYSQSQSILYGAQDFNLSRLFDEIEDAKSRGVYVALSIDGNKKSGNEICELPIPNDLFQREILINCGRSMLRRFQLGGESLEDEVVHDRLLLTY